MMPFLQCKSTDRQVDIACSNCRIGICCPNKHVNLMNDACMTASHACTHIQFLWAMSHCVWVHYACWQPVSLYYLLLLLMHHCSLNFSFRSLVSHFPFLHFPFLHYGPAYSHCTFSTFCILVPHFQPCVFHLCIFTDAAFSSPAFSFTRVCFWSLIVSCVLMEIC